MERLRRLATLWNWLPEFRASAETEHLTTAARELGVSPSAVSRTIRLLEDDVGRPLFDRVGRRIELNGAGEHLLDAVRVAMRSIDEALAAIHERRLVGPVSVATAEPTPRSFLVAALLRLKADHPALVPTLGRARSEQVAPALLRGDLDVALTHDVRRHPQLTIRKLGALPTSVYVGRGHPLAKAARCGAGVLAQHGFVVLARSRGQIVGDGWPPERRRRAEIVVQDFDLARDVCLGGAHVAVLPDVVAAPAGASLRRLPVRLTTPIALYAMSRLQLDLPTRADAVVDAVRAEVEHAASTERTTAGR